MWAQLPNSEGVAWMWKNPSLRMAGALGSHERKQVPQQGRPEAVSFHQATGVSSNSFQKSTTFSSSTKSIPISEAIGKGGNVESCTIHATSFLSHAKVCCVCCVPLPLCPASLTNHVTCYKPHTSSLSHVFG